MYNKFQIFIFALLISLSVSLHAQEAKTLFVNVPDSLTPLLTPVNRADFIDFLESNMKAAVKNRFDETSEMTDLTPDYIRIKMSDKSTWEMKLFTAADSTRVIAVASTVCAPVCNSKLQFFSTDWKELPASAILTFPTESDFLRAPSAAEQYDFDQLRLKTDITLIKAELSKDADTITFVYTTPDYLTPEDAEKLKLFLLGPLVYRWNGSAFER